MEAYKLTGIAPEKEAERRKRDTPGVKRKGDYWTKTEKAETQPRTSDLSDSAWKGAYDAAEEGKLPENRPTGVKWYARTNSWLVLERKETSRPRLGYFKSAIATFEAICLVEAVLDGQSDLDVKATMERIAKEEMASLPQAPPSSRELDAECRAKKRPLGESAAIRKMREVIEEVVHVEDADDEDAEALVQLRNNPAKVPKLVAGAAPPADTPASNAPAREVPDWVRRGIESYYNEAPEADALARPAAPVDTGVLPTHAIASFLAQNAMRNHAARQAVPPLLPVAPLISRAPPLAYGQIAYPAMQPSPTSPGDFWRTGVPSPSSRSSFPPPR